MHLIIYQIDIYSQIYYLSNYIWYLWYNCHSRCITISQTRCLFTRRLHGKSVVQCVNCKEQFPNRQELTLHQESTQHSGIGKPFSLTLPHTLPHILPLTHTRLPHTLSLQNWLLFSASALYFCYSFQQYWDILSWSCHNRQQTMIVLWHLIAPVPSVRYCWRGSHQWGSGFRAAV